VLVPIENDLYKLCSISLFAFKYSELMTYSHI